MAEYEEEKDHQRPSIRIPLDLGKLLPYILLIATVIIAFVRNGDSADVLKMQVQSEQATIQKLSEQLSTISERLARVESMSDRLARVETKLDNYMANEEEDRARDHRR